MSLQSNFFSKLKYSDSLERSKNSHQRSYRIGYSLKTQKKKQRIKLSNLFQDKEDKKDKKLI